VYEHILNDDLELRPTASADFVRAILLERDGMEVDGWKIKVVVGCGELACGLLKAWGPAP
jgi:hypothetical protein